MDFAELRVELEKEFTEEITTSLRVELINKLLSAAQVDTKPSISKMFNGVYFKISVDFCPEIWRICQCAQKRTKFTGKIDFYIINSSEYNAFCLESTQPDQNHIICLNSSIIKNFSQDELLFVIGHEIGHLWTGTRALQEAIQFIFNENKKIPFYYHNRIMYWQRLSELSADRFGLLACGKLESAVSSFFKLTSGLDWYELGIKIEDYTRQNDKLLESVKGEQAFDQSTHPINPVRVKALQLFAQSKLFASASEDKTLDPDPELSKEIKQLMEDHTALAEGLNHERMLFMATGGLIISGCDQTMDQDEYEKIISYISRYTLYPRKILEEMIKNKDLQKIFVDSTVKILKANPSERDSMLSYLLEVAIADNDINEPELQLLVDIGVKVMGYNEKEVSQAIAAGLYSVYIPQVR